MCDSWDLVRQDREQFCVAIEKVVCNNRRIPMKIHLPLVNKRNLKLFIRASFLMKQNNVSSHSSTNLPSKNTPV